MDSALKYESVSFELKANKHREETWRQTIILSFQSLGVVYGRLSTAPLYVFGLIKPHEVESEQEIYELFSFIFWTFTIIPLLKYAFIVLKADDDGEGGTLSLYSLLCRHAKVGLLPNDNLTSEIMQQDGRNSKMKVQSRARIAIEKHKSSHYLLLFLALFGCCMIIDDGVLTPSVSVLSATSNLGRSLSKLSHRLISTDERRKEVDKVLSKLPLPLACSILVGLFTLQHYGTQRIGIAFAPVVILWLIFISSVGLYNIIQNHEILSAVSPMYMIRFIMNINVKSWKLLGSVVLSIAGTETMFADLGHFSKRSIKATFICLIYPSLVLCYAGQAAFIAKSIGTSPDIFHISESVPSKNLHHAFAVLSIFASAVGSQATITASFSIINQCQALSCFPRVKVVHTSKEIHGRVYIPDVNWLFMILCLGITVGFHQISPIGKAAGLAVILGMLVTTCLMSLIIFLYWEKSIFVSVCFLLFFGFIETIYLSACLLNFPKGAWSIAILLVFFLTIMISWHYGTLKKYQFDIENKVSVDWLTDLSPGLGISRVPGIGFIYTDIVSGIPAFFTHFITNLPAFHQVVIFVSFKSLPVAYVPNHQRYLIGRVGPKEYKIFRCIVLYGYCDCIRDTDDFESDIISSIGDFILIDEPDVEAALTSPEGKMMVFGRSIGNGIALVVPAATMKDKELVVTTLVTDPSQSSSAATHHKQKKVQFMLPSSSSSSSSNSPTTSTMMNGSVREELQALIDARESGSAYFLGKSHFSIKSSSSFIKKVLVFIYVLLDKNCREPTVALNIPHAELLQVGMVYTI